VAVGAPAGRFFSRKGLTNGIFGFLVVASNYRKNFMAGMCWTDKGIAEGKSGAGAPQSMTLARGRVRLRISRADSLPDGFLTVPAVSPDASNPS
jgi:hypothetical protein